MHTASDSKAIAQETVRFVRKWFQTEAFVPLHAPILSDREKQSVNEAIDSTFVSSVGAFVNRIEDRICQITGSPFAIATVTGTAALQTALRVVGVQADTEVVTQPLSFVATANAIRYQMAHPVFVDVDAATLGLSADALQAFFEEQAVQDADGCVNRRTGRRIAACVPMHSYGFPVDIERIRSICRDQRVPLVEDAAESLGSTVGGLHTGTFGEAGIISFNGNKIVTAGGGGVMLTQDAATAKLAKHLTTTAKQSHPWEYVHDRVGYNYRMPNLNAALLSAQLERLPDLLRSKRELAAAYQSFFRAMNVDFVWERDGTCANFWLMTIRLENREARDQFLESTNAMGVMTRPAWSLLNELPMYSDCQSDDLSNARMLSEQLVNLPSSAVVA